MRALNSFVNKIQHRRRSRSRSEASGETADASESMSIEQNFDTIESITASNNVHKTFKSTPDFRRPSLVLERSDTVRRNSAQTLPSSSDDRGVFISNCRPHRSHTNFSGRNIKTRIDLLPTIPSASLIETAGSDPQIQPLEAQIQPPEGAPSCEKDECKASTKILADSIITKLAASALTDASKAEIDQAIVDGGGWEEQVALCIMHHMMLFLRSHMDTPGVFPHSINHELKGAYMAAKKVAAEVCGCQDKMPLEHPVYAQVVTLGVLSLMLPEVVFRLGFHELGLIPGTWAQAWKLRHGEIVSGATLLDYLRHFEGLQGQNQRTG